MKTCWRLKVIYKRMVSH